MTTKRSDSDVVWRRRSPLSRAGLLAKLRRRLPARVSEAYLFGSHARDEASTESDVDLIIVAESTRTFPDRFRDFVRLGDGLPPMDLLVYTPAEWRTLRAQPSPLLRRAMAEWNVVRSR
jgi:predicted nucleotidyltransferase